MGSDLHFWQLAHDRDQAPAELAATRVRVAELEAENTALRAGLAARDETIARLSAKPRSQEPTGQELYERWLEGRTEFCSWEELPAEYKANWERTARERPARVEASRRRSQEVGQ